MFIELTLLLASSAASAGFWLFWKTMYQRQERRIENIRTQVPPPYVEDAAPPYEERDSTPLLQVDPPQY